MTLSKLAKLANVSVSVVSKAFSGREDVSDAMREHVFSVAKQYGCFQQFYHAPYDKPVIAVIIPEAISQYYIHYMECLKQRIEQNGYTMLLSISNFDDRMKQELVRYYTEHSKVNGLICFGNIPKINGASDTALVSISSLGVTSVQASTVSLRLSSGLECAIARLKELGHTRIAYVGEAFTENKQIMVKGKIKEQGLLLPPEYEICSRARFEMAGADGVERLWTLNDKPTAIIGAYGYITRGILSALDEKGVSVPGDVSVVSLDNDPYPLSLSVDVSCVPSDVEIVCDEVISALEQRLASKNAEGSNTIEVPTRFYEGATIAKAKK